MAAPFVLIKPPSVVQAEEEEVAASAEDAGAAMVVAVEDTEEVVAMAEVVDIVVAEVDMTVLVEEAVMIVPTAVVGTVVAVSHMAAVEVAAAVITKAVEAEAAGNSNVRGPSPYATYEDNVNDKYDTRREDKDFGLANSTSESPVTQAQVEGYCPPYHLPCFFDISPISHLPYGPISLI